MFQQNQKTILKKKNVYSFISMNLRIVFKVFQKTDFFWSDYEPPSMRTLVGVTTEKKIKNVKKQLKTKKRLFKIFQKNKKQKFKIFSKHWKWHELSSKKVICIIKIFEKKIVSATSWWFACRSFWSNQNFRFFEKTIFMIRNSSKN